MKKPAVVSLVVLALISSSVTSAFAAPAADPAAPSASRPRAKKQRKPKSREVPFVVDTTQLNERSTPRNEHPSAPPVEVAHAEPPVAPAPVPVAREEARPIALAPLAGYASQHLNLGFGARASYTFSNHVTVAGTFVYHLGTSEDVPSLRGATASQSVHAFYPAAEVGYDVHVDAVTIRPYAGVGALFVTATSKFGDTESSDTTSHFALYPGVTGTYAIPDTAMFAGADLRVLIVTNGGDPSFGFFGTFGVRL